LLVGTVAAVLIGYNPGDSSIGGGFDEFNLLVLGCEDGQGDDETILAFEGGDQRFMGVVVDIFDGYAVWDFAGTTFTADCGELVFAILEQMFGNELADLATGLVNS